MTKTNASKPKPEPSLGALLSEGVDEVELAKKALAEAEQKQAEKMALLDEQLAYDRASYDNEQMLMDEATVAEMTELLPLEEKRDKAIEAAKAAYEKAATPIRAKYEAVQAKHAENQRAIVAHVEDDFEVPEAVFLSHLVPKSAPKESKGKAKSQGKRPKVSDLGICGPFTVTAPHRYPELDPTKPTTVVYEVKQGEGGLELFSKRIDEDYGKTISEDAKNGPYTHHGTPTVACSAAGWHSASDVMYALAVKTGIVSKFPEFEPASDPSDIFVDGQPLVTPTAPVEVTIKETV